MRCLSPSLLIELPCTPLPGLLLEDTLQGGRGTRGDLWAVLDNVDVKQPTTRYLGNINFTRAAFCCYIVTSWPAHKKKQAAYTGMKYGPRAESSTVALTINLDVHLRITLCYLDE